MTQTVSTAPPHVDIRRTPPTTVAPALAHAARPVDRRLGPRERRAVGDRRVAPSRAATCAGRSSPSSSGSSSGSSGAIVAVTLPAAGFDLTHRRDLLAHLDPEPRRRDPAHPVLVPRAEVRRPQLDHHLGRPAARCRRSRWSSACRTPRRRSACCSARRRSRASAAATSPARCRTSPSSTRSGRRAGRSASTPPAATSAQPSPSSSCRSSSRSAPPRP